MSYESFATQPGTPRALATEGLGSEWETIRTETKHILFREIRDAGGHATFDEVSAHVLEKGIAEVIDAALAKHTDEVNAVLRSAEANLIQAPVDAIEGAVLTAAKRLADLVKQDVVQRIAQTRH